MKSKITINANRRNMATAGRKYLIWDCLTREVSLTNLLIKGKDVYHSGKNPFPRHTGYIFTYTIKDKKGTDLTGTNTMFEGTDIKPKRAMSMR